MQGDVVVDVSFVNTTTEPGDFNSATQSFTFSNGEKGTKEVVIATIDDETLELDETL
ncbi:hypothetical protein [uncultured Draconibacterium sp.]|uniref:hypothetical protein n=1 Tax=uncultured Draconibacterium sp. TaxID=1573823 RepID=UPI003747CB92